jgi:hypothetical protein
MSSNAGTAIGVPEGVAVILRQAEKLASLGDMLMLFAIGVACFGSRCKPGSPHPPDPALPRPHRPTQPGMVITGEDDSGVCGADGSDDLRAQLRDGQ